MSPSDPQRDDPETLLSRMAPPEDMVKRVVERSLGSSQPPTETAPAWRRRAVLAAALVLVLASSVWLAKNLQTSTHRTADAPDLRSEYRLTNRDGLLVLLTAEGQVLSISGESER